jgi:o-succinylbenzoate synthase
VKITRASVTPVRLALAAPLATARGPLRSRDGALLSLSSASGASGWGEALPLPGFGLESAGAALDALEDIAASLVGSDLGDLDTALDALAELAPGANSARAAADVALHDLAAREAGCGVAALLAPPGQAPRRRVEVSALVSGDDAAAAGASARRARQLGFRTLKLKLLAGDLARDEERVAAVRKAAGAAVKLRLDANGAWKEAAAFQALERLARFDIELIEQPVAAADVDALARLRAEAKMAVAADEAVRDEESAARLLAAGAADLLVLKPAALGGLRAAARIAARARRAGVGVVVTSFLDSSLGIAAALHFAAALPESPFAAGLATAELLADDLAAAFAVEAGAICLPDSPGLGVAPDAAARRRCAAGPPRELRA